jgi:gluconolactonase
MKYLFVILIIIIFLPVIPAGYTLQSLQARDHNDPIIAADARLELLFDAAFFAEGPAVAPDGCVFFSDITFTESSGMQAGHIWKYDPDTRRTLIFRSPSGMANGIIFDRQGRMLVAEGADYGGRRITRTDLTTGKSTILCGLYQGKPFNSPNDLALDLAGRIYFTDPRYSGHEPLEQPLMGVYRIDPDGTVTLISADAGKPNGIIVSPDQETLYVGSRDNEKYDAYQEGKSKDPGFQAILAFDLSAAGEVSNRRILVDFLPAGGPDGLTIDEEGNIYAAVPADGRPGIYVYSAEGQLLTIIDLPKFPSNVTFGRGKSAHTLNITAENCLFSIPVRKKGFNPAEAPQ